jgi:hypothetical protein
MSCVVPIPSPDFYEFESYDKILNSLECLEDAFNRITTEIETKINESRAKVTEISTRVANCKHKIGQIEGSTKALTILSNPKFPQR